MKKLLVLAAAALLLAATACQQKKVTDITLSSEEIETVGDAFQQFAAAGDVKLFLTASPDDPKKWTIRATLPITKTGKAKVPQLEARLDLLDANGARVHDDFGLKAQELDAVLPVLAAEEGAQRTVVFASETLLDQAAAEKILEGTRSLRLNLTAPDVTPEATPAPQQQPAVTFPANVNLNSLIQFYGIRSLLSEYERAYRSKNKSRMQQLKKRFDNIVDKVTDHPRGGRKIGNQLEDWIDDQMDEIEDRVDKKR